MGGASVTQEGVVSSKWARDEEITSALKQVLLCSSLV